MKDKQSRDKFHIIIGLMLFGVAFLLQPGSIFSYEARAAFASLAIMVYWWITRPVHIAVTALLPIVINSLFQMAPMDEVLKSYASPIVVLLLGANILTISWEFTGLDKKIALKSLSIIGLSVKWQLVVWFVMSVLLSAILPNAVVAATLCPIAYAMMQYVNGINVKESKNILNNILLMIVWGAGLGGFGTPLGGAMNLVAIAHIESITGEEFMFIEWVIKMLPYLVFLSLGIIAYILITKNSTKQLPATTKYFRDQYEALGKTSRAQAVALLLFVVPVILSFLRPLYAGIFPELKPFFAFLIFGVIALTINGNRGERLITWEQASGKINWGLMILFSGGLAIGNLLNSTGFLSGVSKLVSNIQFESKLPIVALIILLSIFMANASSNTAAVAVSVPLVIGIVSVISPTPFKYIFLTAAACNCAFLLPTSIRAIPLGYGLDPEYMLKKGFAAVLITFLILLVTGYINVL